MVTLVAAGHAGRRVRPASGVLTPDFTEVGYFDTVTAVHLLEHLAEDEVAFALTNMLSVTTKRLIVAVPYEKRVQPLYGHQQAFTPDKVQFWGAWCVDALGGPFERRECQRWALNS